MYGVGPPVLTNWSMPDCQSAVCLSCGTDTPLHPPYHPHPLSPPYHPHSLSPPSHSILPFSFHRPGPTPVTANRGSTKADSSSNSPSNARPTSVHAAPAGPARSSGIPRPKQPQQSHLARIASRLASLVNYHVGGGGGGKGARNEPVAPAAETQALLCECGVGSHVCGCVCLVIHMYVYFLNGGIYEQFAL